MPAKTIQRVAFVNPLSVGGICHYTFALGNALARLGCEVTLVTSPGPFELAALERHFNLATLWFNSYAGKSPVLRQKIEQRLASPYWQRQLGAQLGTLLKQARAQVVHQHWLVNPVLETVIWRAVRGKLGRAAPLVYTAHEVFPHERYSDRTAGLEQLYREIYREPDRIVLHGAALRQQAIEEAAIPLEKIRLVPHGNYHFLADHVGVPSREEARRLLGLSQDQPVILFFGYIRHYKGLDVLLLALERLLRRPKLSQTALLVAGFLPQTDWLASQAWDRSFYGGLARSLGLERSLRLHTDYLPIADIGRFFAAADLVCLPYRSGSQSGVLQLAYAFSRPVVATRVGSLEEGVDPGRSGLLVSPEAPDALAEALEQLLLDPAGAERMGRHAREWSGEAFAWGPIAERTLAIYAEGR